VKIAVASGKGGTGKTTIAVNLALSAGKCTLVDCDVEEPNCALFLDVEPEKIADVTLEIPDFDLNRCNFCGQCADFCMYNAIAVIPPDRLLFFPELCHSCGGCALLCPEEAITEVPRVIGEVDHAATDGFKFYQGRLEVGEAMATPVIRKVKSLASGDLIIYDAPPGTSCPMIDTLAGADYALLVTEPTPFGLHDLKLAVEVVRKMEIPFSVVINRHDAGDEGVEEWCRREGIEILMRIPEDRRVARLYSRGIPFTEEIPEYREQFRKALTVLKKRIDAGRVKVDEVSG